MSAKLIDGKSLAQQVRQTVAAEVAQLNALAKPVNLVAILVGDQSAAKVYAESQRKACQQVGIAYHLRALPEHATQEELVALIGELNSDAGTTGIFLHTPLPGGLDIQASQYAISVMKDVEGVNPANIGHVFYGHTIIAPCTAVAVVEILDAIAAPLRGAEVVIVGASTIGGRPIGLLLTARDATVTLCHFYTKDLAAHTRRADILIVAVGKPNLIDATHVKPGAVVVDVGINRVAMVDSATGRQIEKTVGDVNFNAVYPVAARLTPVPGGVGPMTVAMLLKNTVRAAKLVHGIEKP